jgi:hypothetical protein
MATFYISVPQASYESVKKALTQGCVTVLESERHTSGSTQSRFLVSTQMDGKELADYVYKLLPGTWVEVRGVAPDDAW